MNKVNFRQVCIVIFLSMMSLKFLSLPGLIFIDAKNDSWFVILISTIIDALAIIVILFLAKDAKKKSLKEYLEFMIGKVWTKIFLVVLLAGFMLQLANSMSEIFTFVMFDLFEEFSWFLFAISIVAVLGFMSYKGLRNISRTAEIFYIVLTVGILFICFSTISKIDPEVYKPFFTNDFASMLKAGFTNNIFFGSGLFLFVLFGDVDFKSNKKIYLWLAIIISILLIQLTCFVFYGLFSVTSNQHFFALADIAQVTSTSTSLYRLQWFVSSFWLIDQLGYASILMYSTAKSTQMLFNIKNWYVPNFIISIAILIWIAAINFNGNLVYIFTQSWINIIILVFSIGLPLVALIIRVLRRKKFEKANIS